jgi:hypothetical protein
MIQTTKDADKAKTSQRQRVDDQNDRFVSRNCHHAPPSVTRVLGVIPLFLQRIPGFAARRTARDRKRARWVQSRGFGRQPYFYTSIPHTFDKINTALFLWLMIRVLGHRKKVLTPALVPSAVSRGGGQHGHLLNCPASAEVFRAVIINCPKDTRPSDQPYLLAHKLSERY